MQLRRLSVQEFDQRRAAKGDTPQEPQQSVDSAESQQAHEAALQRLSEAQDAVLA